MEENNQKPEEKNSPPQINIKMARNFSIREAVAGIIIIMLLVYIVVGWVRDRVPTFDRSESVNAATLEQSVREIGELATLEYSYETVVVFNDQRSINFFNSQLNIPGTARSFIVKFDGRMRFGIDVGEIRISIAPQNDNHSEVRVSLPTPTIQTHEVNMDSVELLDESTGFFVSLELEDYTQRIAERQAEMEAREFTQNLLAQAKDSAENSLRIFLRAVLDEEYTIYFSWR
jgi:hypothetical protein